MDTMLRAFWKLVTNKLTGKLGHWITTKSGQRFFIEDKVSGLFSLGEGVRSTQVGRMSFIFNTLPSGFTRYLKTIRLERPSEIFPGIVSGDIGQAVYKARTIKLFPANFTRTRPDWTASWVLTHEGAHFYWRFSRSTRAMKAKQAFASALNKEKVSPTTYAKLFRKMGLTKPWHRESFADLSSIYRLRRNPKVKPKWITMEKRAPGTVAAFKELWNDAKLVRSMPEVLGDELAREVPKRLTILLDNDFNVVDSFEKAWYRVEKEYIDDELISSRWIALKTVKLEKEIVPKVVDVLVEPIWRDDEHNISRAFWKLVINKLTGKLGHWITTKSGQRFFIEDKVSKLIKVDLGLPGGIKDRYSFLFNTLPTHLTRYIKEIEIKKWPGTKVVDVYKAIPAALADYRTGKVTIYHDVVFKRMSGRLRHAITHDCGHLVFENPRLEPMNIKFAAALRDEGPFISPYANWMRQSRPETWVDESFAEIAVLHAHRRKSGYKRLWNQLQTEGPGTVKAFKEMLEATRLQRQVEEKVDVAVDTLEVFLDKSFAPVEDPERALLKVVKTYLDGKLVNNAWIPMKVTKPEEMIPKVEEVEVEPIWRESSYNIISRLFALIKNKVTGELGHWITTKTGQKFFIPDKVSNLIKVGRGVTKQTHGQFAFLFNTMPAAFTHNLKRIELFKTPGWLKPAIKLAPQKAVFSEYFSGPGVMRIYTGAFSAGGRRPSRVVGHICGHHTWRNVLTTKHWMPFRHNFSMAVHKEPFLTKRIADNFGKMGHKRIASETFAELSGLYRVRKHYSSQWQQMESRNPLTIKAFKDIWGRAKIFEPGRPWWEKVK